LGVPLAALGRAADARAVRRRNLRAALGFQIQKLSDYGTSTPAVARTLLQSSQLMQAFPIEEATREAVRNSMFELQRHLIRCIEVSEKLRDDVLEARQQVAESGGLSVQSRGRAISLPGIGDLTSRTENFLQASKLAIRETGAVINPFFGTTFDHRFHLIVRWAESTWPEGDQLRLCVTHYEPLLKQIVQMRNAVDHPTGASQRLIVHNFRALPAPEAATLLDPAWGLSDDTLVPIVEDMQEIIEFILRASEDLLSLCLMKHRGAFPVFIHEVPESERDPACPFRLRVSAHLPKADA
jgi:hypothetical protein